MWFINKQLQHRTGDNLDYGDYFRPVQVIDYTNNASGAPKVIDYGHRHVAEEEFKPMKVINYDHAPKNFNNRPNNAQQGEQQARRGKNRRNNNNKPQQKGQQQHNNQQKSKTATQSTDPNTNNKKEADVGNANTDKSKINQNQEELEDISDTDEIPDQMDENKRSQSPAPPPPPLYSSRHDDDKTTNQGESSSSIFPSTAQANDNITKMTVDHVQMSIPTVENNNTISIEEILLPPGRETRPKKICIILRGPPGSGKSYVAKLIKDKEKEMSGNNPRVLSIDDYFLIENDYEEKCPKTGKKIPKKEILYEYDKDMEATYMQYLIKSFKKTILDNFYDFIVIDCNNNSLRTLNEFYCHAKDSGYVPYIIDLFCELDICLDNNVHERSEADIKEIIDTWKPTPFHYIKLDVASLVQNVVEMEDVEDMPVDEQTAVTENSETVTQTAANETEKEKSSAEENDENAKDTQGNDGKDDPEEAEDDSNDSTDNQCNDRNTDSFLVRINKFKTKRKQNKNVNHYLTLSLGHKNVMNVKGQQQNG